MSNTEELVRELDAYEVDGQWVKDSLQRPDCFAYFGSNEEMFETWSLGPVIEHRNSDVVTRSNAEAMRRALTADTETGILPEDDWELMECNHWAVRHVTHLTFRTIDESGSPTRMAKWVKRWYDSLEDYCIADEQLLSEMEWEESYEALENILSYDVKLTSVEGELPEDYQHQIHDSLSECICENSWPIDEIREFCASKGWLACETCGGDGWVLDPDAPREMHWKYKPHVDCPDCRGTGRGKAA